MWNKQPFFGNYSPEKLSPPRKNYKYIPFFSKLAPTNTSNKLINFLRFRPQTRKISKKSALIFC